MSILQPPILSTSVVKTEPPTVIKNEPLESEIMNIDFDEDIKNIDILSHPLREDLIKSETVPENKFESKHWEYVEAQAFVKVENVSLVQIENIIKCEKTEDTDDGNGTWDTGREAVEVQGIHTKHPKKTDYAPCHKSLESNLWKKEKEKIKVIKAPVIQRGFSLKDALEIAYLDDSNVYDIFIEPPDCGVLSDEDSGDEDGGGLIDNLPGSQLSSAAELKLPDDKRIGGCCEVQEDEEMSPLCNVTPKIMSGKHFQCPDLQKIEWIEGDFLPNQHIFCKSSYGNNYKDKPPIELFEKFFDDEVVDLLVEQSRKYALYLNNPDPKITTTEIKCFLAILILTGYSELPGKRFYWDEGTDMRNELVYNSMRRNRFLEICRFIHFADNAKPDAKDKIWKLRPIMDKIKSNCLKIFEPEEHLCYDESMIKYYGKHGCKQFIRGKPIRFGYKMWCLNTPSGYVVNFEIYQGNNPRRCEEYEKLFGKSAAPLVVMLDELVNVKGFHPYKLYFDNLFTGFTLLKFLRDNGYQATGTVRENRLPKNIPLSIKKTMTKRTRGTHESIIDRSDGIIIVRWVDNSVVTVASTCFGIEPVANVRRFSQADKKYIQVQRPDLISKYNNYMGGTDRMDQNIAQYRIGIRDKKWWWSIFSWLIDVCVQNAWQVHRKSGGFMSQLEFRRSIVQTYLKTHGIPPKGPGRPAISLISLSLNRVSDELRYDGINHLVIPVPNKKRRRCAGEGCISHIRTMCQKCNVGLCIKCFAIFHTK